VLLVLLCCQAAAQDIDSEPRPWAAVETTPLPGDIGGVPLLPSDGKVTVISLTEALWASLRRVLDDPKYQEPCVAVGLVFGLVMVANGEFVFRWCVVVAMGLLGAILSLNEFSTFEPNIRHAIAIEVGLVCAYAAWKGIDGVMLVAFGLMGTFAAFKLEDFFALLEQSIGPNPWHIVIWYSLFTLLGMLIITRRKHVQVLAMISPLLGAPLVSASLSWMLTALVVCVQTQAMEAREQASEVLKKQEATSAEHFTTSPPTPTLISKLQPEQGTWFNFLLLLLDSNQKDVGIFAHTHFESPLLSWMHGRRCCDRVVGILFALIIFLIGFSMQRRRFHKKQVCAREPSVNEPELNEALLGPENAP